MLQEFLDYLEIHVGTSFYVMGAQGQSFKTWDEAKTYINKYSQNKTAALKVLVALKAAGVKIEDVRAYDCSGLGVYFFLAHDLLPGDRNANGLYGLCTKITKTELIPGDMVFVYNALERRITHVGYVAADGQIIEAKGSAYGVVKRPLAKGNWNRYGRPPFWKNESEDTDMLKQGDKNDLVKAWQNNLLIAGNDLKQYGADGSFGPVTVAATNAFKASVGLPANGIVDGETWSRMADVRAEIESQKHDAETDMLQSKINAIDAILHR